MKTVVILLQITVFVFFFQSCKHCRLLHSKKENNNIAVQTNHFAVFDSTNNIAYNEKEIIKTSNRFAFNLFRQINVEPLNYIVSPYSINSAMAMVYTGSMNKTRKEIGEVFGYPDDNLSLAGYYKEQHSRFNKKAGSFTLSSVNGLWYQHDFSINPEYIKVNEHYYHSATKPMDFKKDLENSRLSINKWVSDKTDGSINNIIGKNQLDPLTRLVIANAVFFKADWQQPFETHNTKQVPFYSGSSTYSTSFMNQESSFRYYENRQFQAVELLYENSNISMLLILPTDTNGLETMLEEFSEHEYTLITRKLQYENIKLQIPKFEFESFFPLENILPEMGMRDAFTDGADFRIISPSDLLKIDKVLHKAFIQIDEHGTKATAATVISMKEKSSNRNEPGKIFRADHPFFFIIRDIKSSQILFLGQYSVPE